MKLFTMPFSNFNKSDKEEQKGLNYAFTIAATEGGVAWTPGENPFNPSEGIPLDKMRHRTLSDTDKNLLAFHTARSLVKYSFNYVKLDTIKFEQRKDGSAYIIINTDNSQIEV